MSGFDMHFDHMFLRGGIFASFVISEYLEGLFTQALAPMLGKSNSEEPMKAGDGRGSG